VQQWLLVSGPDREAGNYVALSCQKKRWSEHTYTPIKMSPVYNSFPSSSFFFFFFLKNKYKLYRDCFFSIA